MNIGFLRDRQIQILKILSETDAYYTWEKLSEAVGVSTRTIMREIDGCAAFLASKNLRIERKLKCGVRLVGSEADLTQIYDSFKHKRLISNSAQRLISIKQALLSRKEPVKLYVYARKNDVVESTVGRDLDKLHDWFLHHNLRLIRRQGVGVYLEGSERDFRSALISLYYEALDEQTLYNLVLGEEKNRAALNELLIFASTSVETFAAVAHIAFAIQQKCQPDNPGRAAVSLCLHLLICLLRTDIKEYYEVSEQALTEIPRSKEYETALEIAGLIQQSLGIALPGSELYYIAMHLKSMPCFEASGSQEGAIKKCEKFAHRFLMDAQKNAPTDFDYTEEFARQICNHLVPAIQRIKMGLDIRNPLESEIKSNYPEIFHLAKKCVTEIEQIEHIKLPDSEIAYLALYLGALMSEAKKRRMYKVAICCPAGMSSSMMLSARLREAFDNITVEHILPISDINAFTELRDVDFVISTIDLAIEGIDVVVCHPLLKDEDQKRIIEYLERN